MTLNFPKSPPQYSETHQDQVQGSIEREDKKALKIGQVFKKILLEDTVTGETVTLTIASGAVVIT